MTRHPLTIAFAALLLHVALLAAYVAAPRFGGEVSALVCVARERLDQAPFRRVRVGFPSGGYDGQAYYVIAQAPWRRHSAEYIDKPSYRHLRLLYPALCWLFSGGDARLLFWTMPAVNLLAIAGLAGLGALHAVRLGRTPWLGLLLPLAVNAGMPALRNLTDPLSTFTVTLLLVAWLHQWRAGFLTLSALLAALAREQNVAVIALITLLAAWERDWRRVLFLVMAMMAWAAWVAMVWFSYDDSPFALGNFGPPLAGMMKRWSNPAGRATRLPVHAAGLACVGVEMLTCLLLVPLYRPERSSLLLGWAGVALAALGSSLIFDDLHAYLRVFPWLPLSLWLWAAQSGRRWPFIMTLPLTPWPLLALLQVW